MGYNKGFDDMQGYTDDHGMVAPVGSYAANRFGLFDMAGNVSQWCQDSFRLDMIPPDLLAKAPGYKEIKDDHGEKIYVLRGSTWQAHGDDLLSYWRLPRVANFHPDTGGFRCVLVIKTPPKSPTAS